MPANTDITPEGVDPVVPSDFAAPMMAASEFAAAIDIIKNRHAQALGVAVPEMMAMSFILQSGSATPKAIANELQMSTGAVTALLDRLEISGVIVRKPNPTDRRSTLIALTEGGAIAISGDWVDFEQRLASVASSRTKTELETITRFLMDFSAALRD